MPRLLSPWKTKLLPFLAVFDIPDSFFDVLTVSDWFHKLPWHVRSPKHLKFLTLPWKKRVKTATSFENSPFAILVRFGRSWRSRRLLWSLHRLWLFPEVTLTCDKSRATWMSHLSLKKVHQDCRLLGKLNGCHFWLFLTLLTAFLKSSLSLIDSIRYPYLWEVQNTLIVSPYLEQSASRLPSPLKTPFLPFWLFVAVIDVPDSSFDVFNVSKWFLTC